MDFGAGSEYKKGVLVLLPFVSNGCQRVSRHLSFEYKNMTITYQEGNGNNSTYQERNGNSFTYQKRNGNNSTYKEINGNNLDSRVSKEVLVCNGFSRHWCFGGTDDDTEGLYNYAVLYFDIGIAGLTDATCVKLYLCGVKDILCYCIACLVLAEGVSVYL